MPPYEQPGASGPPMRSRFLTNYALVLACVAEDRDARVRTVAARVGITERAAHTILADLVREGYVRRNRMGRRNRHEIVRYALLGDGFSRLLTVADLVDLLSPGSSGKGDFTNA